MFFDESNFWHLEIIYAMTASIIVMGPLPTDWIFDWQVSLAYATTVLCILLLQYILKLILYSELSFRGPKMGPYQLVTRIRDYVLAQNQRTLPSWFTHQLVRKIRDYILTQKQKIPVDSHFNWQTRISRLRTHKKIPVDSHINWQTRIRVYVLMQNSSGFLHQLSVMQSVYSTAPADWAVMLK